MHVVPAEVIGSSSPNSRIGARSDVPRVEHFEAFFDDLILLRFLQRPIYLELTRTTSAGSCGVGMRTMLDRPAQILDCCVGSFFVGIQ
jgi:hypothetical protein